MRLWIILALAACGSDAPPPRGRRPDAAITPLPPDPAPLPVGDLPVECGIYKALAVKAAACEQLGNQRKLLQDQFETSWKAWTQLPKEERGGVATGCRAAADALRAALVPCT